MRNPTSSAVREGSSEADLSPAHDITVHLDAVRHRKLKQLGAEHRLSPEDLLVKALDTYLEAHIK